MPKLAHCSDLHLDHLARKHGESSITEFGELINRSMDAHGIQHLMITGDISNSSQLVDDLTQFMKTMQEKQVFFVLGNHDFYGGTFDETRAKVDKLQEKLGADKLCYVTNSEPVKLFDGKVLLTGHDGWYDGGYADWFDHRVVVLNDEYYIKDLEVLRHNRHLLYQKLRSLAKKAVAKLEGIELKPDQTLVFLTHVPPYPEACSYRGKPTNEFYLPCFSSQLLGDALFDLSVALEYEQENCGAMIQVFCGHTHGAADFLKEKNLRVRTAHSEYTRPETSFSIVEV